MIRIAISLLLLPAIAALPAQAAPKPAAEREAAVDQQAANLLLAFARNAKPKLPSKAFAIYDEVLDYYDAGNRIALQGLGWRQVAGDWQPPDQPLQPLDTATPAQGQKLAAEEQSVRRRCAALHRELGFALLAEGERAAGLRQLEHVLAHDADDVQAHEALGHVVVNGAHLAADEAQFAERFLAIAGKARELLATDVPVTAIDPGDMPRELRAGGVALAGARTVRHTVWIEGDQATADRLAQMAERCHVLLQYVVGPRDHRKVASRYEWIALTTRSVYLAIGKANAEQLVNLKPSQLDLVGGTTLRLGARFGEIGKLKEDKLDAQVVAYVAHRACGDHLNGPCGEGLATAMTWLLCGSTQIRYMHLASTVSGEKKGPATAETMVEEQQTAIRAGKDTPLLDVLRSRSDTFSDAIRGKAWLFMLWLPARHPDRWYEFAAAADPRQPEEIDPAARKVLGCTLAELDEQYRQWARGDRPVRRATGIGR